MVTTQTRRLVILATLILVMAATRIHLTLLNHAVWDASWAVFFLAGFWLRGSARWAFPLLMAEAVALDYLVISQQGLSFWSHYCMSPAYLALIPAYFSLWMGGSLLARHIGALNLRALGLAAVALVASVSVCYLISNGSFYWLSDAVPMPRSLGAWGQNLQAWYLPFLKTTATFVALGGVMHVLATQMAAARQAGQSNASH